jgi:hypothetical protein
VKEMSATQLDEKIKQTILKVLSELEDVLPKIREIVEEGREVMEVWEGLFIIAPKKLFESVPGVNSVRVYCRRDGMADAKAEFLFSGKIFREESL